jgi:hypothetical protein
MNTAILIIFISFASATEEGSNTTWMHDASSGILELSEMLATPWEAGLEWKPAVLGQLLNISRALEANSTQEQLSTYLGYASSLMNQWRLASVNDSRLPGHEEIIQRISTTLYDDEMRGVWLSIQGTSSQMQEAVKYFINGAVELLVSDLRSAEGPIPQVHWLGLESVPLTLFEKNSSVLVLNDRNDELSNWLKQTGWFQTVASQVNNTDEHDTVIGLNISDFCGNVITSANVQSYRMSAEKTALLGEPFVYLNPC